MREFWLRPVRVLKKNGRVAGDASDIRDHHISVPTCQLAYEFVTTLRCGEEELIVFSKPNHIIEVILYIIEDAAARKKCRVNHCTNTTGLA